MSDNINALLKLTDQFQTRRYLNFNDTEDLQFAAACFSALRYAAPDIKALIAPPPPPPIVVALSDPSPVPPPVSLDAPGSDCNPENGVAPPPTVPTRQNGRGAKQSKSTLP